MAYIIIKVQCVRIILGVDKLKLMRNKVIKSKSFVPAFDMVKSEFYIQGGYNNKQLLNIIGLYYHQSSMCQNHTCRRQTIVDEK